MKLVITTRSDSIQIDKTEAGYISAAEFLTSRDRLSSISVGVRFSKGDNEGFEANAAAFLAYKGINLARLFWDPAATKWIDRAFTPTRKNITPLTIFSPVTEEYFGAIPGFKFHVVSSYDHLVIHTIKKIEQDDKEVFSNLVRLANYFGWAESPYAKTVTLAHPRSLKKATVMKLISRNYQALSKNVVEDVDEEDN